MSACDPSVYVENGYANRKDYLNRIAEDSKCVYVENGYANRKDYLECIAEDYDVPIHFVLGLASMLGPSEDFDGLVCALEDMEAVRY